MADTIKTFTFDSYVLRGEYEREVPVEVTYTVDPQDARSVQLLKVTNECGGYMPLRRDELWTLQDEACDRADEDLAEYYAEQAEMRAEMIAERGWA